MWKTKQVYNQLRLKPSFSQMSRRLHAGSGGWIFYASAQIEKVISLSSGWLLSWRQSRGLLPWKKGSC